MKRDYAKKKKKKNLTARASCWVQLLFIIIVDDYELADAKLVLLLMALYHAMILQVALLLASNPLVSSTWNESSGSVFQFALVVTESEDASSFYGGGSINESLSAVDLGFQHVSSCPNIPWHTNLVHMFARVSSVMILYNKAC